MPPRKPQLDLTDKENPPDTPKIKIFRKPKSKLTALEAFQAKVAATRLAGQGGGPPAPPQSTAPQPNQSNTKPPAQLSSKPPPLGQSITHKTTQPQPLTQASLRTVPNAAPIRGLAPPVAASQDGSKSSLTYADLPSDFDDPAPTFTNLPPRLSQSTGSFAAGHAPELINRNRPSGAAQPWPSQLGPTPLDKQPPTAQPRASTSSAFKPGAAFAKPTTLRKPRSVAKTTPSVSARLSTTAPALPDRFPTSADPPAPDLASRRTSTVSHASRPSSTHRNHKALRGQPPPPNVLPPPDEPTLDPAGLLAAFKQAHAAAPTTRERRMDIDEGEEYVSDGGEELQPEVHLSDGLEGSDVGVEEVHVGIGGNDEDEADEDEGERELGEDDLGELLGKSAFASSSTKANSTANGATRSLRSSQTEIAITPTLNGSSDAVPSRSTNSTTSSARKRKQRSPSPNSAEDSDDLPPHMLSERKSRAAAKRGKAGTKPRKGLAVIKRRAPTALEDRPVKTSAAAMALLPPRRAKGRESDESEVESTSVDSDDESEDEPVLTKRGAKMSRAKNGKRATASPPPTGRRGRARAGTPASELGEPTKSRRSRRKRRKSPIVEEDEEDEEEILSKYEREKAQRRKEMEAVDAFKLEEVLVVG